ncbi:hypothetical protein [Nocardioides sp. CFH 31398]|uniref:hypothetical protein n=1 Tax=Nocardioides sp. CFH 31398 TaxID=2919579 RepID=UPI001F05BC9A|nr:hypothetical protein [Nocardioides sp. CFH 31398]MCH1866468.1 hypothetical protein [Nocardioides sp. CFH 31398]
MTDAVRVDGVDEEGLRLTSSQEALLEVRVAGARVWSFWVPRDVTEVGDGQYLAAWPGVLRRYLKGRGAVTVLRSPLTPDETETELWDGEVRFDDSGAELVVRNPEGTPLQIDKSGRLVATFEGVDPSDIEQLLDHLEQAVEALRKAGAEPFVAYGTLLGAVREGRVLGHDSDADLAYVSTARHPVDVTIESYRLQRALVEQGMSTIRYSGANFKVLFPELDGNVRGIDVFSGFLDGPTLYLMGEIGVPMAEADIRPLSTATLNGRVVPTPARPEALLEATYGEGWRVPDPAFKFETSDEVRDRLSGWFRGQRFRYKEWVRAYALTRNRPLRDSPTRVAKTAHEIASREGWPIVEVGAGRGADGLWLARKGHDVEMLDVVHFAADKAVATAREEGLSLDKRVLNLLDTRSVLGEGARLVRRPGPRVVVANHVLDALGRRGTEGLARFCALALRGGGALVTQFYARRGPGDDGPSWIVGTVDVDELGDQLRQAGARHVEVERRTRQGREVVSVVGEW